MTDEKTCSHCGGPVSNRGPEPADGRRFCMAPLCQRTKRRAYMSGTGNVSDRVEDRPCSSCQAAMPVRAWRSSDLEIGRWCSRRACQRDRAAAQADEQTRRNASEQGKRNELAAWAARTADHHCGACGLTTAKVNFTHPVWPEQRWCAGDGGPAIDVCQPHLLELAKRTWPADAVYEPVTTTPKES